MMAPIKFRYYITDLFNGCIRGTDNEEIAHSCAECEDYFVVDCVKGEWFKPGNEKCEVEEIKKP